LNVPALLGGSAGRFSPPKKLTDDSQNLLSPLPMKEA
jgi:hypothetical protein